MPLFLRRLEDRILFDAAAVAVIADAAIGQAGEGSDNAPVADQAAPDDTHADTGIATPAEPDSAIQEGQINVLLVSSNIDNAQQLADAAADDVTVIFYDYHNTTLEQLEQMVNNALQGARADTISFATEGQSGLFYLLKDTYVTSETLASNSQLADFWRGIGEMLTDQGRVDLLGCFTGGLDGNDYGLLSALDSLLDASGNDIDIAASTDMTGNRDGSNWILEVGNIDASAYFNENALANWTGDLATFTVTNTNDSGAGSLRSAISGANAAIGFDVVEFDIPASSTINTGVGSGGIYNVFDDILIDGKTANGYQFGTNNMVTLQHDRNSLALIGDNITVRGLHFTGPTIGSFTELFVSSGSSTITENVFNNGFAGILVRGTGSTITGNHIGTNAAGDGPEGTMIIGIQTAGSGTHTIGGDTVAERNIISGSNFSQIVVSGSTSATIQGNYIGPDITGTNDITPPTFFALGINGSTSGTINIGGINPGEGNLMSGLGTAIRLNTTGTFNIQGNLIGTDVSGTSALTNADEGIRVNNAGNLTIGGNTDAHRNIISGNTDNGINILNGNNIEIKGNFIGTDINGTSAIPNGNGIGVNGGSVVMIGGDSAGEGNLISGNTGSGISVTASTATIYNNLIGTDVNGTNALGNGIGVSLSSATSVTLGGTGLNQGNVISGNGDGVFIVAGSHDVIGNLIGTAADGVSDLGNTQNGVRISGGSDSNIGGAAAGAANTIAFNDQAGVLVDSSTGNSILRNSIFDNSALGIDLINGGNNDQPAPTIALANYDAGTDTFTISGQFDGNSGESYTLEFFGNPADNGTGIEGKTFLGILVVVSTGPGTPFTYTMSGAPPAGSTFFTATVTSNASNDTSEFSGPEILNSPPVLENNNPATVFQGETVPITSSNLLVSDAEQAANELIYAITDPPKFGQFEFVNDPSNPITSFTQADINAGRVIYRQLGADSVGDSVLFNVDDQHGGELAVRFNVLILKEQISEPRSPTIGTYQEARNSLESNPYLQSMFGGRANGFFNVEGNNQLTSFGDRLGYEGLSRFGDNSLSFSIVNGDPELGHTNRNTGFGSAVNALEHAIKYWGVKTITPLVYDSIEDLAKIYDSDEDFWENLGSGSK